jgi:hypothetical protein
VARVVATAPQIRRLINGYKSAGTSRRDPAVETAGWNGTKSAEIPAVKTAGWKGTKSACAD